MLDTLVTAETEETVVTPATAETAVTVVTPVTTETLVTVYSYSSDRRDSSAKNRNKNNVMEKQPVVIARC